MSQGGQTSRRTPQYNDPYQAINATGVMNATSPGKPFGAGNSMSDPFANQPKPNQSPTVYTTQDNNYQNPVLGGVNQTAPANNVYAGTTSLGTMSNQANPYVATQANAMQYTNTTNSLFPLNQVDGEKNGLRLNPDLNSFDTPNQPVDQNYVGSNLGQQPVAQQSQPNTYGNANQSPYSNNNGAIYSQAPINSTNNYNIARDYDQMYMSAPLLPQVGDARPSGNTSPYQNNNPYFDTSTAEGSMDYLNSIAPSEQPKTGLVALKPSKLFPIIGGAMLALVILVAVVAGWGDHKRIAQPKRRQFWIHQLAIYRPLLITVAIMVSSLVQLLTH